MFIYKIRKNSNYNNPISASPHELKMTKAGQLKLSFDSISFLVIIQKRYLGTPFYTHLHGSNYY